MHPLSTPLLHLLREQLLAARTFNAEALAQKQRGKIIDVPGIGQNIASAYEQLRRAAESVDEQLLLQRAIRRFYRRSIAFSSGKEPSGVGSELILDLTHAGYLANQSVSAETAKQITRLAQQYVKIYQDLGRGRVPRDVRLGWVLDILSVETEALLNPRYERSALAYVAYRHFLELFPREKLVSSQKEDEKYEFCLYIAVHQALFKSDLATVRHDLIRAYRQSPEDLATFAAFNQLIDDEFASRFTQKLRQAVNRYGAPLRIVLAMSESRSDLPELLENRDAFLDAYRYQIGKEYKDLARRLNRGLIRSIIFVFVTKISVGIAIEIPYDVIVLGSVAVLPLAANLFFPPLYMASFKLGLHVPSVANAAALQDYIDQALFSGNRPAERIVRVGNTSISPLAKVLYTLLFAIPLGLMAYVLTLLHFTIVQGIIFFVFLCTASFLGFRLTRLSRELELMPRQTGLFGAVRDFFHLPFATLGRWISGRYARLNLVSYILDILVELPLKTALRLVRQWVRFLNEKHEEMY